MQPPVRSCKGLPRSCHHEGRFCSVERIDWADLKVRPYVPNRESESRIPSPESRLRGFPRGGPELFEQASHASGH